MTMSDAPELAGPDLCVGTPFDTLADGIPVRGHIDKHPVVLVLEGNECFAIGAFCTHHVDLQLNLNWDLCQ
jgi:hypothetical protein